MYIQHQWTVPCVFRNSEIMLFSFRLPVVVSVGLLSVPFVTLLYIIITCFCFVFFFILNTNRSDFTTKAYGQVKNLMLHYNHIPCNFHGGKLKSTFTVTAWVQISRKVPKCS